MTWTTVSDQSTTWTEIDRVNENLISYSEDFAQWPTSAIVSGNVISDTSTTSSLQLYLGSARFSFEPNEYVSRCFSATVKKDNVSAATRTCRLRIGYYEGPDLTGSFNSSDINCDTSTGEIYNINYGSVEAVDYGVIDEGDNWRFWVTSKFNGYFYRINIFPASANTANPAGSVTITGSITLINAQFETGTYPSRYLATNGTPVSWEVQ